MCTSNAGCAALSSGQTIGSPPGGICTPGLLPWHQGETQRGYDCAIQGLGTLSASCAVPEGGWRGGQAVGSCGSVTLVAPEANLRLKCKADNCAFTVRASCEHSLSLAVNIACPCPARLPTGLAGWNEPSPPSPDALRAQRLRVLDAISPRGWTSPPYPYPVCV